MRVLSLVVAFFLFISSLEAWAGYWLAGRWFVSSKFASVSLGTVRDWVNRGIVVPRVTQQVKIFINRHGKWILLTLAVSEVISEVERLQNSSSACYVADISDNVLCYVGSSTDYFCYGTRGTRSYFSMFPELEGDVCGIHKSLPAHHVYVWNGTHNMWVRMADVIPVQGRHFMGRDYFGRECYLNVYVHIQPCPFPSTTAYTVSGYPPSGVNWQERRRVPVRVFPNPIDFVRPDVIDRDPSLRWLRDEYQRLLQDASIPTIPSNALGDLELPTVDWAISPDEAIDFPAERGSTREGAREGDIDISIPGLDTSLNVPERRAFPVELLNSIVQSHPLLRVLQGVNVDAGGGGSCVIGSSPFRFDFCQWQWVLNLMGGVIVFVAFLTGMFWAGRSE